METTRNNHPHQIITRPLPWRGLGRLLFYYLIFSFSQSVYADLRQKYNEQNPVIFECDLSYAPYEFLNEQGKPDGFFIDLMTTLLKEINIPYKIVSQERHMGRISFLNNKTDLICDEYSDYDSTEVAASKFPIVYEKIFAATHKNTPPLRSLKDLTSDDVVNVKHNDYIEHSIVDSRDSIGFTIIHHAAREGLADVKNEKSRCFIWGEELLRWQLRALRLEEIRLDELDLPVSQIHILGHDQELIDALDDQYARFQQQGRLQPIRDKWFHPERKHNDTSYAALVVILFLAVIGIIIFLLSRLMRRRLRIAVQKASDLNYMMEKALDIGDYYVTRHDLENDRIYKLYGNVLNLPEEGMPISEFIKHVPPEMRDQFNQKTEELRTDQLEDGELNMRWHASTNDNDPWRTMHGFSTVEYEKGKPRYVVSSAKDITQELEDEKRDNELGERFYQLFDTNLVAMSFYSPDGMLIDANHNMRILTGMNDGNEEHFRKNSIFSYGMLKDDLKPGVRDVVHVCQHTQYPDLNLDKYLEMRFAPSFDDTGNIIYYIITARDITEERKLQLLLQKQEHAMHQANDSINKYEHELEFLLKNSGMYIWQFNLATRDIQFSRSLSKMEFSMNREEYIRGMVEDEREQADKNLMEMIMKGKEFNAIHHFNHTPANPNPCWYELSGIPSYNEKGMLTGYFGVARDITALMEAQQKLKQETCRAESSGRLKSAFLANMSHEIRTPLNAIVGFSDLLPVVDTEEERMEFIRIIRNNCDMLLRLINDILEVSYMTTGAITITPTEVDFAQVFKDICQTLEQRVQEPGVAFIKDNPYESFVTTIDKGRMQQVITNFVTNAVKYTREGHIKVGYEYKDGGIYMYCEDTGVGIPKEKQSSVFERFVKLNDFVQGTGLGLSICKTIAERSNGKIGVNSEGEGKGSTFWIWIPCERKPKE